VQDRDVDVAHVAPRTRTGNAVSTVIAG
jgi:hypothetical protein